jgi:uncharacterized protein
VPLPSPLADLAEQRFVSLTTFRRSGEPVATVVWVAREGDALVVTTPADSGKVKRLRRDPRVELRPANRRGRVAEGAAPVAAVADVEAPSDGAVGAIRRKYGLEYRIITTVERALARGGRDRVILRMRAPAAGEV